MGYKVVFLILVVTFVSTLAKAQALDCRKQLSLAYKTERAFMEKILSQKNNFHIKYSTQSLILNRNTGKHEKVVNSGEVIAGNNFRYMKSESSEVFIDNKDIFSISSINRKVTRLPFQGKSLNDRDDMYAKLLDSSILMNFTVQSCTNIKEGSVNLVKYILVPNNKKYSSYASCIIYIEQNSNVFRRVEATLNPAVESDIKSYVFTIIERKATKTYSNFKQAKDILLDANGKLKGQYSKYRYHYVN